MCLVIDTNVIASVFSSKSAEHDEFKPVLDWIKYGNGKLVLGGSTYKKELKNSKYLKLINKYDKARKVVKISDDEVDAIQHDLKLLVNNKKFDDSHLAAIITVSKCRIICTKDDKSHRFILDRELYPKGVKPPKIYKRASNKNLLIDKNIVQACVPCQKLNKYALANLEI